MDKRLDVTITRFTRGEDGIGRGHVHVQARRNGLLTLDATSFPFIVPPSTVDADAVAAEAWRQCKAHVLAWIDHDDRVVHGIDIALDARGEFVGSGVSTTLWSASSGRCAVCYLAILLTLVFTTFAIVLTVAGACLVGSTCNAVDQATVTGVAPTLATCLANVTYRGPPGNVGPYHGTLEVPQANCVSTVVGTTLAVCYRHQDPGAQVEMCPTSDPACAHGKDRYAEGWHDITVGLVLFALGAACGLYVVVAWELEFGDHFN
jgi:hypothetical protein